MTHIKFVHSKHHTYRVISKRIFIITISLFYWLYKGGESLRCRAYRVVSSTHTTHTYIEYYDRDPALNKRVYRNCPHGALPHSPVRQRYSFSARPSSRRLDHRFTFFPQKGQSFLYVFVDRCLSGYVSCLDGPFVDSVPCTRTFLCLSIHTRK